MSLWDHDAERKLVAMALHGDVSARDLLGAIGPSTRARRLLLAGKTPTLPEGIAEQRRIEAEWPITTVSYADLRRRIWISYMRRALANVAEHGSERDIRRAWAVLTYPDDPPSEVIDLRAERDAKA